jgi:uncharacterized protein (DUF58 family)
VFSDRVETCLQPCRERRQLGAYLAQLYARFPSLVEPDFESAINRVAARNRRRCLVVLFTDLTSRESAQRMAAQMMMLVPRHVPLVVTIADETLRALEQAVPQRPHEVYAVGVANQLANEREETLRLLRARGAEILEAAADALAVQVIERYLDLKRRVRL